jgi:PHD/YefM family antitoxin component YafN of YafNO toxin-antitoxin module
LGERSRSASNASSETLRAYHLANDECIDGLWFMMYNIGMTKVSTAVARKRFSDMVNRASYAKERVALTRYGHTLAAIVPAEDLALLEAMEDRIDADDASEALAEMKAKGEKPIPLAKVKKRLGL